MMRLLALACRRGERSALDPLRHVRRRVLLEEALALPAVRIALHRERPTAQVRDEDLGDVPVVRDQVALRDPLVGPERLVEVREPELPFPPLHHGRKRSVLAAHVGCLACPRAAGGTRGRAACPRASTPRTRPRRRARGSTQTTSRATHTGHLRRLGEGRVGALERCQKATEPLDLVVGEARPDVSGPAQHTRVVYPGDERAETADAAALPARVPGDDDLLRLAQLDLVPVGGPATRAGTASRSSSRRRPRAPAARAAARSAGPSSNCGETMTPAPPGTRRSSRFLRSVSGSVVSGSRLELEQVEEDEHRSARSLLQQREARAALLVERADLAVEHGVGRPDREARRAGDVAESARSGRCRCGS